MKIRDGFVSNSSSTGFIIINKTNEPLTLVHFVKENPQLIEMWNDRYVCGDERKYTQFELLTSAMENDEELEPGDNHCIFGDEQGTLIGRVFDYMLRDGGESESFSWDFSEWHR